MIATTLFALVLTTAGTPLPGRGVPEIVPTAGVATAGVTQATRAKAPTRYCVRDTITGSRIPQTACRTRAEWLARGFDPLDAN